MCRHGEQRRAAGQAGVARQGGAGRRVPPCGKAGDAGRARATEAGWGPPAGKRPLPGSTAAPARARGGEQSVAHVSRTETTAGTAAVTSVERPAAATDRERWEAGRRRGAKVVEPSVCNNIERDGKGARGREPRSGGAAARTESPATDATRWRTAVSQGGASRAGPRAEPPMTPRGIAKPSRNGGRATRSARKASGSNAKKPARSKAGQKGATGEAADGGRGHPSRGQSVAVPSGAQARIHHMAGRG